MSTTCGSIAPSRSRAGRLIVRLGAGQGLRFGRNLVQVLVHKTHPYKRQSSYDIESRTVYINRNAPIASAGADQTITQGDFVRLDGLASKLPPRVDGGGRSAGGSPARPEARRPGSATLRAAAPAWCPTEPAPTTSGCPCVARASAPPRRRPGTRAPEWLSDATGASNDTATVTVMPDIPPMGVRLDTVSGSDRSIRSPESRSPGARGTSAARSLRW